MEDICKNPKIIKKIGHGVFGITYMVKHKNKKYAMKIQKILPCQRKPSTEQNIWREIHFARKMNKYPNQFMKLYCHKIINKCVHIQPKPEFKPNKQLKEYLTAMNDSPYCMMLMYDLKDGVIGDLFWKKKITQKQIYSYIAQMVYAVYVMKKNHYVHNDLHMRNIAYTKTDKKYIKLGKQKVRTYGYIYSAIDYGEILHPKFKGLKEWQLDILNNEICDLDRIIDTLLIGFNAGLWDMIKKGKLFDYVKANKKIRNSKEYKKLKDEYDMSERNDGDITLFKGVYPELALKFAGIKRMKSHYKKQLITVDDYIFMWENRTHLMNIIKYFTEKANE